MRQRFPRGRSGMWMTPAASFAGGLLEFLRANVHDASLAEDLLHEVF